MRDATECPLLTPDVLADGSAGPIRFSLRDTPERRRSDLYREFFGRSVMRYEVAPSQHVPLDIDVKLQMLPGLLMVTGKMHGSRNQRTQRCLADGLDDIAMAVNLGGRYVISQGGREVALGHGEATLFSLGRPCELMHWPPGHLLALRFPRSQIVARTAVADDGCMRPIGAGTQALRLLTEYVGLAQDRHSIANRGLQRVFADHVYDLVALAVGAPRDVAENAQGRGLQAARLHVVKQDVARNLDRPGLTVAGVASRIGCTPRLIQRLFEMEGTTFTEYVLARRLERAHGMLTDPRRANDKISTIALDSGFGDISYFNRAFRRYYGSAPSDIRVRTRNGSSGGVE